MFMILLHKYENFNAGLSRYRKIIKNRLSCKKDYFKVF